MLKLSPNQVGTNINKDDHKAFKIIGEAPGQRVGRALFVFFIISVGIMFLPWTQNIRANGFLTALSPEKRPQSLQSIIGGRIENWYVREGDFVNRGDTILHISEVK